MDKKTVALITGITVIGALEFTRIYVPECVDNKLKYRCRYVLNHFVAKLAKLGSLLGVGSEPVLLRKIIQFAAKKVDLNNYPNIIVTDRIVNGNRIRIYKSKNEINEPKSIMFYYHGGGYALNSLDNYHHILLPIASQLDIILIAIDYPLAPENRYPTPVEESFNITNYIINNPKDFDLLLDKDRIVLAGDSAGANIAIVLSNRFKSIDKNVPKLQALINPPTQYINMLLPSMIRYSSIETFLPRTKMILWHLGISNVDKYQEDYLLKNYHTILLDDENKPKLMSYLDINLIPEVYRSCHEYINYDRLKGFVYPRAIIKVNDRIDKNYENLVKNLFNENISPGLVEDEILKKQPKTYIVISEMDTRKDEGLIYAQRLINNGVECDVAYYHNGFHTSFFYAEQVGCLMRNDLINYLRNNL
ncbi:unnamed protein product [Brachionus calyciflorus]|uniref:Alpha/beta hydrolase fold-3 domain-containing protein n=1 Tax=Brachionus calyciflorus TaxID=104777 RepID=A0A814B4E5_9BILA|nr:unnamed protein product [Brachionus calyciflorus]